MGDMLFVALGVSGGTVLLCGLWGLRCLVMGLLGYEELPKLRKRKIPRKAATSHGIVGQRVRRSACEYSKIIIDYGINVNSKPQVFVEWRYMRG